MHADVVVFILVLLVGCAALLFGVLYLIVRALGGVGRGVLSMFGPSGASGRTMRGRRALVCPRPQCRKVEYRDARYCSQCGERLVAIPVEDER